LKFVIFKVKAIPATPSTKAIFLSGGMFILSISATSKNVKIGLEPVTTIPPSPAKPTLSP